MSEELEFSKVHALDVKKYIEKKGQFNYLSWANAWAEFVKIYPNTTYEIKKFTNKDGVKVPYMSDKTGFIVNTSVKVGDIEHEMLLPVMDFRNKANLNANMMDINKAIMRCLTKNLAMFGLGLYVYKGEDLPEADYEQESKPVNEDKHLYFINNCLEVQSLRDYITENRTEMSEDAYLKACAKGEELKEKK